jgi:putative glutamine amidotransferase
MAYQPVIGVTGPITRYPTGWWATSFVLRLFGAHAVHLYPGCSTHLNHRFDAIVIGGGDDIDASLYGDVNHELARPDPDRDAFEVGIIEDSLRESLPLLGVCRGAQLINVVKGGSLFGDIRGQRHLTSNRRTPFPAKTALIDRGSRLAACMLPESWLCHHAGQGNHLGIRINSLHHQAVDRLGEGLRVVGWDRDDFVQAIESVNGHLILGVQWHPEYLPYLATQRRIFAALVDAAGKR